MHPSQSIKPQPSFAEFALATIAGVGCLCASTNMHAETPANAGVAVGAQYDTTHVYIAPADFDRFIDSFVATFGGKASDAIVANVLPVPSQTRFRAVRTPVGALSAFAFTTPVPYPFGQERTGYLVSDMDQALREARAAGAEVLVDTFKDAIGYDAVIQWPGGVKMQLYWHFTAPSSAPLATIPDNRVYVSADAAERFVGGFLHFSHGRVVSDEKSADAGEIGRPQETYRRVRIESAFGKMQVNISDGHLPYPFGYETTGYEVVDLAATVETAKANGAKVLSAAFTSNDRITAVLEFPGGYIAEVHSPFRH